MLFLREANFADIEKEYLFVREVPADENGFINDWAGVSYEDFRSVGLKTMIDWSAGENLPEGYVPETYFFLWNDDEIIGQYRIRHFLCESLINGAGHIGCFIAREQRGRGFGTEGLRLALEKARDIVPEDEIYLRVNKNNPASLRAMLKNGGYIHHEDGQKYYVRIKK